MFQKPLYSWVEDGLAQTLVSKVTHSGGGDNGPPAPQKMTLETGSGRRTFFTLHLSVLPDFFYPVHVLLFSLKY